MDEDPHHQQLHSAPLPEPRAADLAELADLRAAEMQLLAASDGGRANGRAASASPVAERWAEGDDELSYGDDIYGGDPSVSDATK